MENKHTPGPWYFHDHETMTAQVTNSAAGHGFGLRVADIWATDLPCGNANARLIAACPDLLAALEACVIALEDHLEAEARRLNTEKSLLCPCFGSEIPAARAAIARARGE